MGVCRGVIAVKLDGEMLTAKKTLIPLADDGGTPSCESFSDECRMR